MVVFYSSPKKNSARPARLKLQISAIDAFGQGIARHNGKTIFVKNALPNEEVDVQLTDDKKQYAKAKVTKYHSLSTQRVEPRCPHYQVCGGCEMQHMPIDMQHEVKKQALSNLFSKEADCTITTDDIQVIASQAYHYRRRARLAILFDKNRLVIGFRQLESNQIVDIQTCPVLVEQLANLLMPLKACLNEIKDQKALGHLELIDVDSGSIVVLRHTRPLAEADIVRLTTFAQQQHVALYLHGKEFVHLAGQTEHYYCINQLKLTFSPLNFIQVNGAMNLKMVEQALDWLNLQPDDGVLDLFCGMGNFSLPLATRCQQVIGVEGVDELVNKAQKNMVLNNDNVIAKSQFFVSNLEDSSQHNTLWYTNTINKVLLDPARAGALQIMDKIIEHSPSHVVYISCNPATLVRDSKKLLDAGYVISKAAILDMFPQTKHIESMLLFRKLGRK